MAFELESAPMTTIINSSKVYMLVSTAPNAVLLPDGLTLAGNSTVVQRIIWDGVSAFTLPPNTKAVVDDGTQIGSIHAAAV